MTIFVVQARGTDAAELERARFVRDGFSWPAFVLAQLWLLYHRLWFALTIWIVVEVAFFVVVYPYVSGLTAVAVDAIAHLYLGFEGNRLRLAKGARKAVLTDVIEARTRDGAEMTFYRGVYRGADPDLDPDLAASRDQVRT